MKPVVKLCAFLLSLMGIASCDFLRCEYGTPNADYQIKGKVTDMENNPIEGIQVNHQDSFDTDVAYTKADGTFEISFNAFPPSKDSKIDLTFTDADGTENGEFADKTENISVTQAEEGSGSWYEGMYTATDVTVKMEEK